MKNILIIHPEGNLLNNPSLYAFVCSLKDYGVNYKITINKKYIQFLENDIGYYSLNNTVRKIKKFLVDYIGNKYIYSIFIFLQYMNLKEKFDLIIGVDREGVIEAWILSKIKKIPYAFFSFEIKFMTETSDKFKLIEKKASNDILFCIVQDKKRGDCLIKENDISGNKIFYLPLAGRGLPKINQNYRVRDELKIPVTKKVAIFMGSISKWTMIHEIIKNIEIWHDEWVLLIHSRYGNTKNEIEDMCNIEKYINNKIYISNSMYNTNDDLYPLLNGVDCGLALYSPTYDSELTGLNIKYMGMSSGKISTFLRYDIPVIINSVDGWSDIVKNEKLGFVINDPNDLGSVLAANDMDVFKGNCVKYFMNNLDFNIYERELMERIYTSFKDL